MGEEIRMELEKLIKLVVGNLAFEGEVLAVDADKLTCKVQPTNGEAEFPEVKIKPIGDDKIGAYTLPKVGSIVTCVASNNSRMATIVAASEIESFVVNCGESKLQINKDGVEINSGKLGGMAKIESLKSELQRLENNINTMKAALTASFSALAVLDSGASSTAFSTGTAAMQPQNLTNLENEKVRQ